MIVDLDEQLLEEVVPEGVNHHHGQVGKGLHEDRRNRVVFTRFTASVSLRRPVTALIKLLLQQPAPDLERAVEKHRPQKHR